MRLYDARGFRCTLLLANKMDTYLTCIECAYSMCEHAVVDGCESDRPVKAGFCGC